MPENREDVLSWIESALPDLSDEQLKRLALLAEELASENCA